MFASDIIIGVRMLAVARSATRYLDLTRLGSQMPGQHRARQTLAAEQRLCVESTEHELTRRRSCAPGCSGVAIQRRRATKTSAAHTNAVTGWVVGWVVWP